ncbi:MAG: hypothetical protein ACR2JD_09640 [Nocardioides sp.]
MRGRWLVTVLVTGCLIPVGLPPAVSATAEPREVIVKPREPRPDVFFLAGGVKPDYRTKAAILQRRNCGGCAWFAHDRFRTDQRSRFRLPVPDLKPGEKLVCYRVKVAGSAGFSKAYSEVNCIGPTA